MCKVHLLILFYTNYLIEFLVLSKGSQYNECSLHYMMLAVNNFTVLWLLYQNSFFVIKTYFE